MYFGLLTNLSPSSSVSANDETPFTFLSLSQNFLGLDNKIISIPCFRILANFTTEVCTVCVCTRDYENFPPLVSFSLSFFPFILFTAIFLFDPPFPSSFSSPPHSLPLSSPPSLIKSLTVTLQQSNKEQMREFITDDMRTDKIETVSFNCPQFGHLQAWHHVVVTMAKTLRQKSKVSLFMDGVPLGVQKVHLLLRVRKFCAVVFVCLLLCCLFTCCVVLFVSVV